MFFVIRNIESGLKKVFNVFRVKLMQYILNINEIIYGKDYYVILFGFYLRDLDYILRKYGSSLFDVYSFRSQRRISEIESIFFIFFRRFIFRILASSVVRIRMILNNLFSDYDFLVLIFKLAGFRRLSDFREIVGFFVGFFFSFRKSSLNVNNYVK